MQNTAPTTVTTATLFPANQYYENSEPYCATNNSPPLQAIVPLSYNWNSLKATIAAMQPTGGTNQAVGMAWAWESLQQGAPLSAPAEDTNYTYNRVIILLSDGLNTEDRWPANGDGSTQFNGSIDARQALLCQNIKAMVDPKTNGPMYTIYTIQVNTGSPADPTSTVLQNCASGPEQVLHADHRQARSSPPSTRSERRCRNCASPLIVRQVREQKKPGQIGRAF